MADPYLYNVTNNVATFSMDDAPWNLMSIEYIDQLEAHLPDVLADEGARIGLPEMDLGSVPAWGGSTRLPRAVGRTYALDMILRGRKIDGAEAYHIGLVSEVLPVADIKGRAQSMEDEMSAVAANHGTADAK